MRTQIATIGAVILLGGALAGCGTSSDEATTASSTPAASTASAPAPASDGTFGDATVAIGTDVPAGDYSANISQTCTVRVEGGSLGDIGTDGASGQQSGVSLSTTSDGDDTVITMTGSGGVTIGFVDGTKATSKGCGTWTLK